MNIMVKRILFFCFGALSINTQGFTQTCPSITFDEGVQRIMDYSVELKIAQSEIDARAGEFQQTTLYPNPVFSFSTDTRPKERETAYMINQLIELGGKRGFRQNAATYAYYAALLGYEEAKIERLNELTKAFVDVAAAQELWRLAQNQKRAAYESLSHTKERVEAGKISLVQQTKSQIAYSNAEIKEEEAQMTFASAKEQLALLWNCQRPDFDSVIFPFYQVAFLPQFNECLRVLDTHPAILEARWESSAAHEVIQLEKAQAIPDISLGLGYIQEQKPSLKGALFGFQIPLPVFDRNQGNVARACSKAVQADYHVQEVYLSLQARASASYKELTKAYRTQEKIRTRVLTTAEQALAFAREGYQEGKFEYSDVLDAMDMLFTIQEQHIDALREYYHRKADLDFLVVEGTD